MSNRHGRLTIQAQPSARNVALFHTIQIERIQPNSRRSSSLLHALKPHARGRNSRLQVPAGVPHEFAPDVRIHGYDKIDRDMYADGAPEWHLAVWREVPIDRLVELLQVAKAARTMDSRWRTSDDSVCYTLQSAHGSCRRFLLRSGGDVRLDECAQDPRPGPLRTECTHATPRTSRISELVSSGNLSVSSPLRSLLLAVLLDDHVLLAEESLEEDAADDQNQQNKEHIQTEEDRCERGTHKASKEAEHQHASGAVAERTPCAHAEFPGAVGAPYAVSGWRSKMPVCAVEDADPVCCTIFSRCVLSAG